MSGSLILIASLAIYAVAVFAGVLAFLRMRRENEELREQMDRMERDQKAHTSSYAHADYERAEHGTGDGPVDKA